MSKTIIVDEITRVEGYGSIEVEIGSNKVLGVKMNISEGPRFFESLVKTVKYDKVPDIMRRICAICTATHTLASITAIEKAFQVHVTPQTRILRDLLIHGEVIESHTLHLFFLVLPDILDYRDVFEMTDSYMEQVKLALQLKKAGNMIHNILSGREVHGMNERVGGFAKLPTDDQLLEIKTALTNSRSTAELAVKLFSEAEIPTYSQSDNIYMALDPGKRFGFTGNHILVSGGKRYPVEEYLRLTNEKTVKHSNAKFSAFQGKPFMVGALPRVLLNGSKLEGAAAELYKENHHKLKPNNILTNNLAQSIELLHSVDRSIQVIDELVSMGIKNEELAEFDVKPSRGIGAIEAPRGILYHDYTFDEEGKIIKANVITPTSQNVANLEKDLRVTSERLLKEPDEKIRKTLEIIARAYDPCISCSVHLVKCH